MSVVELQYCIYFTRKKSKQKENFFLNEKRVSHFIIQYVRIITVSTCLFTQKKNYVCCGCIYEGRKKLKKNKSVKMK